MKTDFKIQNEEEPNKYEQYLKRKQNPVSISPLPSPSARIANRLSEL